MVTAAPHDLHAFSAAVLRAVGLPEDDADLVADTLVTAELWGHGSHGVLRLPWLVARVRAGVTAPVTRPEWVVEAGAVGVLDGHDGVGQVIAAHAMRDAIRRARANGVGAVAVRSSGHFGTAAHFTRMAPPEGCIALLTTNASPAMAPWGGREKAVGTNPWSLAAPAGRHGVAVMDIANTAVARGKIFLARERGEPIPDTWALGADGAPTTDPVEAAVGVILPMAGHKGYAISFMMDVLSGVLTGSAFGDAVVGPYAPDARSGAGHLVVCLHVEAFLPRAEFDARMEALIAQVKAVPLAEGAVEILYPGEPEDRAAARHRREGLTMPEDTVATLAELGRSTGVPLEL